MILDEFFSEIVYVNSNPAVFLIKKTFKENGVIKNTIKTEKINLTKSLSKNIIDDIISYILKYSDRNDIYFYPKNIFQKLFKSSKLNEKLKQLDSNDIVLASDYIINSIKTSNKTISINGFSDDIIIIFKKSKLILNSIDRSFNFNSSNFKIIGLI